MLNKRLGQLADGKAAWLKTVKDDGRIHHDTNPMGAITSRVSHFNPNLAQVPAMSSEYGKECRELFVAPAGWDLLDADMSGLEGRCFAHYLAKHDGGAYGEQVLSGDPHWAVVLAVGFLGPLTPRDKSNQLHTVIREAGAKRLFYAMLYGAGDEKAGRIILDACRLARKTNPEWGFVYHNFFGKDESPGPKLLKTVGANAKRGVVQGIKGFDRLKGDLQTLVAIGWLPGLDKRRIPIRSEHAALNTLLQSAGAIICKRWIVDAHDAIISDGLEWGKDFAFLAFIHDEIVVTTRPGLAERVSSIITRCAEDAGKPYGFRLALEGGCKVGKNWSEVH